jgi:hypothetical protein
MRLSVCLSTEVKSIAINTAVNKMPTNKLLQHVGKASTVQVAKLISSGGQPTVSRACLALS